MFSKNIQSTALTCEAADRLFSNITTSGCLDKSFSATLRALLRGRLSQNETVTLSCVNMPYSLNDITLASTPNNMNRFTQYISNFAITSEYRIMIVYAGQKDAGGKMLEIIKALSLCFLNGGLPQGTPISPFITNVMMLPTDHKISNSLRSFDGRRFVYTRYADDLLISCKIDFDKEKVERFVIDVLNEFNAPFSIKTEKTRYGSSAGRNWNLGLMLNGENQITIGHKRKKEFKAMLDNYIRDRKAGNGWESHDIQVLSGLISYYRMVERDYIDYLIKQYSEKHDVNIEACIRQDISA